MSKPETVQKQLRHLQPGDVLVNVDLPHLPHRTVKRVDQARAKGYVVVQFSDADQTSGHGENKVHVLKVQP